VKLQPLVSIITPAYNQGKWLPDCLESVSNQTYKRIEHIVIDDGSTDDTPEILRRAGPDLRSFRQPNTGQSAALNHAIREARGDVIGWLNSDDAFFDTRVVEIAVATLERHPQIDVVYGHAALVNDSGLILQLIWSPPFNRGLFRFNNFICQPAAFMRRNSVDHHIASEAYQYAMDRDLWLRLLPNHKFRRMPVIAAIDRHHPNRKGVSRLDLVEADVARLIADHDGQIEFRFPVLHKAFSATRRLAGLFLIPHALRTPVAHSAKFDGLGRLALRQLTMSRSAMPQGVSAKARDLFIPARPDAQTSHEPGQFK
jgi:glycosyltransferase involved in cell wall biosynthesis